jgi:ABC-type amino acid transport substrate-binding protein
MLFYIWQINRLSRDAVTKGFGMGIIRVMVLLCIISLPTSVFAQDIEQIKEKGVLRHLGVEYANFVKLEGNDISGMSIEIVRLFAKSIGVQYQFVQSDWNEIIQALIGKEFKILSDNNVRIMNIQSEVRGDLICTGLTVLPWREKLIAYSEPTFPTQIWAITKKGRPDQIQKDLLHPSDVKFFLQEFSVLGKTNTCLDPKLYGLKSRIKYFPGSVNDLAAAVIDDQADFGILDCPDTLIALRKWPEELMVIGPVSEVQSMAVGFRPESEKLRAAFNEFLHQIKQNGVYYRIVKKYYPDIFFFLPGAFKNIHNTDN